MAPETSKRAEMGGRESDCPNKGASQPGILVLSLISSCNKYGVRRSFKRNLGVALFYGFPDIISRSWKGA